jgi:hypothetical protein
MPWASQDQTPDQNWDGATSDFENSCIKDYTNQIYKRQLSYNHSKHPQPRSESTFLQYNFPSCHRLGVTGSCEAQLPEVAGISEYTINRTQVITNLKALI